MTNSPAPTRTTTSPRASTAKGPNGLRSVAVVRALIGVPLVAAVVFAGLQVLSLRNAVEATARLAAQPTPVAVVDLQKVLVTATEAAQWKMKLNALVNSAREEAEVRKNELRALRDQTEKTKEPELREAKEQELALAALRTEEWLKLREIEVDRERALMLQSLMRMLRAEAKAVALSEGYRLVLVDDSDAPMDPDPKVNASREAQVLMRAASLRVLYAEDTIDITDQVIVRLNNAAATQPAKAP